MEGIDAALAARPAAPAEAVEAPVAVEARGVGVEFGAGAQRTVALADVDLTVRRGEFVSLIGPSGCGKTTLLRAIADLEQPTSGTLLMDGMAPEAARLARRYDYVFAVAGPAALAHRGAQRDARLGDHGRARDEAPGAGSVRSRPA